MMTVLSAFLMLLAKQQQHMLWNLGTGYEVPARVVDSLVNGPGFYFGRLIPMPIPDAMNERLGYDGDRILGIAFFWFLIGLSVERRMNKQALDSHHPGRAAFLFTVGALICGVVGLGGFAYVFCPGPNMSCWEQGMRMAVLQLRLVAEYPLHSSITMQLSVAVWLLAFCAYFARRAFNAVRRSLPSQPKPSVS
jgi:hypothetical protein